MNISFINDISKHYDLLFAWTSRSIRARYQQSILGGLWAIAQPMALVIVFTVIFTRVIPIDTGGVPYVVFSYSAIVPWTFFVTSVNDMVESLVVNMNLVSKIYFPRDIFVLAALLARLLDFGIASSILLLLLIFFQIPVFTMNWLYLPIILIIQLALSFGLGLIGAASNVFYRDIKHIFTLALQIWFYATPIIYPITLIDEKFLPIYFLNPMAGIIVSYRSIFIFQQSPDPYIYLSAIVSLIVLIAGYIFFKRVEHKFADVV